MAEPRPEQERGATLRVLVVDDMPEVRHLLEVVLSRDPNCSLVGEAENGAEAVDKMELLRPDLVIMDVQMPVMDGIDATRAIKAQWPQVEIVGFTSVGGPAGHDAMCKAGAAESFDKGDMKAMLDFIRARAATRRPPVLD